MDSLPLLPSQNALTFALLGNVNTQLPLHISISVICVLLPVALTPDHIMKRSVLQCKLQQRFVFVNL